MHVALAWKVIFSIAIALLVDSTISKPTLNPRATVVQATFQVYTLPGCGQTGGNNNNGQETTTYQLPNQECVNTAPIPDIDDRFLSYIARVNQGANVSVCYFDVYPGQNCTGIFSGFGVGPEISTPDYSNRCQNVLQGFTDLKETYGAKSVRLSCD